MVERIKVVFDTGIVLQAAMHPSGPSGRALRLLDVSDIEGFVSGLIRGEYVSVLYSSAVRAKNKYLTDDRAQEILGWLDDRLTLIFAPARVIEYPRDPNDEPIVNLALTVHADYIVSRDQDLFALNESRDFRLLCPFVNILDPIEFADRITLQA